MTRTVQLFHDAAKRKDYPVGDPDQLIRDFVFASVEELQEQDPRFFQVYSEAGELISEDPVKDHAGPYFVSIDIISARAEPAVRLSPSLEGKLLRHLRSAPDVELCGVLLGRKTPGGQDFFMGIFPALNEQTRNYVVIDSRILFLIGKAIAESGASADGLAFGWVHTHLDSPPRLSQIDLGTLSRLRLLHPDVVAMVFNERYPDEGLATYDAQARRVFVTPDPEVGPDGLAEKMAEMIKATFESACMPPPLVML
jgi:proteasome lid subunit RPN8/RPN11